MDKQELEGLLKYHDDLYYNQDTPELSDAEYDILKNQYVELYGEYNYVPGEANKNSKKFKHTTNVSSLDKVQITDEEVLKAHIKRLWPVVIQPKMDGLTLVSYPYKSSLVHTTRGNGEIGEDITNNVAGKVDGIGLPIPGEYPVRSEVVMLKSEFDKINAERIANGEEPFKNTRNAAAGMLRQKDSSKVKGLKAYAYNIIYNEEMNDAYPQLLTLQHYNWNTVDSYSPETEEDALNYILNFNRDDLDYDIDGLVIKHDGTKTFGYTGHHPKGAVAVKFAAEGIWTKITNIVWQVGRTGKLTPVAEFEPIDLLGSEVTRATLHNFNIMSAISLTHLCHKGKHHNPITMVKVIKANDIIPAIIEVRNPDLATDNVYVEILHEPTSCPECHGALGKINDQLFCNNPSCPSKIVGALVHMAKRDAFDIEGLSEETAKKLVDYRINQIEKLECEVSHEEIDADTSETLAEMRKLHPSFIFNLFLDDIISLDGFAKKSAEKLYNNIQKSKKIEMNKFLYGCGMNLVGRSVSKDIAAYYSAKSDFAIQEMIDDKYVDFKGLKEINGIGEETINSLISSWDTHVVPFGDVLGLDILNISVAKKAVNQLTFVITGEFDIKRNDIKALIEEAGHKVSGSVSKKTNYLLASPGEEGTSKYKKAKELDINIINSIEELKELI